MTDLASGLKAMHERVIFDEAKHRYVVDGQALESVTTVLGVVLAKGFGFQSWIAKVTREGKDWRKVGRDEADKGKAVHRAVENWARLRLGLEPLSPIAASPEAAYLASGLPELLDSSGIEPIFQPEIRLYHSVLLYSGMLDLAALWHGVPTVLDIKTCRAADDCWDEWPLQSGAYRAALKSHGLGEWQGAIFRVPKDGGKPSILPLGSGDEDFAAFTHLLSVYRWQQRRKNPPAGRVIQTVEKFMEARS